MRREKANFYKVKSRIIVGIAVFCVMVASARAEAQAEVAQRAQQHKAPGVPIGASDVEAGQTIKFTPVEGLAFSVDNLAEPFQCSMTLLPEETPRITKIKATFTARERSTPTATSITWREPMDKIHFKWNPACYENRFLDIFTGSKNSFKSSAIQAAPVTSLYDISGRNTLTFALSEAMRESELSVRVNEDGTATCGVKLFCEAWEPIREYSVVLRIDRRPVPYYVSLRETAAWWDALIPSPTAWVPEGSRTARYCDWYTFHGKIKAAELERQCVLAKELGMGVFGPEAGWAREGTDHEPDPEKFPDFRAHVRAIHSHGMKFILWVAPSFLNPVTAERFKDKLLGGGNGQKGHLDARYPEVRKHIIDTYVRLVQQYEVDGFFIDFLPGFGSAPSDEPDNKSRDHKSVAVAVDQLLRDMFERLKRINPDILIEFRQPYVGPHLRKYASMFRAVDCGNCFADNRIRSLDIRLLCGSSAAHADPIMWNPREPAQSAAMQLTHTLFSVPQISVDLETLPAEHTAMIRTYLKFWNEHRDVILDGELTPMEPQSAFPVVLSATPDKLLAAVYGTAVVPMPAHAPATLLIVNGTCYDRVVIEAAGALGKRRLSVVSCTGDAVCDKEVELGAGLHRIDMPPNGYATLRLAEAMTPASAHAKKRGVNKK